MTVRLEPELKERLERLAEATQRTKSFLLTEALRAYLDHHAWQVEAIEQGVRQADQGDVILHGQVRRKWEQRRDQASRADPSADSTRPARYASRARDVDCDDD